MRSYFRSFLLSATVILVFSFVLVSCLTIEAKGKKMIENKDYPVLTLSDDGRGLEIIFEGKSQRLSF